MNYTTEPVEFFIAHIEGETNISSFRDESDDTEWNGEGLPPVGVECEFYFEPDRVMSFPLFDNEFSKCVVKAYSGNEVWIDTEKKGGFLNVIGNLKFRKLEENSERKELLDDICEELFGELAS